MRATSHGLFDPRAGRDGCGFGFVARLHPEPTHEVVARALTVLERMEHRGAEGADPETGDGAGILLQVPDRLYRQAVGWELPEPGRYGVAMCFLPQVEEERRRLQAQLEDVVVAEGQRVLGWREVPVDPTRTGTVARGCAPHVFQLFLAAGAEIGDGGAFERKLYAIRRVFEQRAGEGAAIVSCSSRTVVYKGMLTAPQLAGFYPELNDERLESQLALVHSRFSTNTFPSWELAHPYRVLAHNGEINTLTGNRNWMRAREAQLESDLLGADVEKLKPIVNRAGSDSATLDNALELLVMAGRSLPEALMTLIPEAPAGRDGLSAKVRDFYDYHACVMEPWDGPTAVGFSDGRVVGAMLDRNGLRPARWLTTEDGYVVLASEVGVLPLGAATVQRKGRLAPGQILLVDLERGQLLEDVEVKERVASAQPYGRWHREGIVDLDAMPEPEPPPRPDAATSHALRLAFGYTQEDLRVLLEPMAVGGAEPIGSMGNDLALAALSDRQPLLFSYFKQLFAQVTNPPIDPLREQVVMSLVTRIGPHRNLLDASPEHCRQLRTSRPIRRDGELERLRRLGRDDFPLRTIDVTWPRAGGATAMEDALERACREAEESVASGAALVVLSDRAAGPE
ncbi:MAG TPA: glutamate synthase central domain-containing protein, partial [Solirubrobacterales bacterium]|nr:glutamate synthase central domain-containing protein [Solirubrobacterales bacterium]